MRKRRGIQRELPGAGVYQKSGRQRDDCRHPCAERVHGEADEGQAGRQDDDARRRGVVEMKAHQVMSMRQLAEDPPQKKGRLTDERNIEKCLNCTERECKGECKRVRR